MKEGEKYGLVNEIRTSVVPKMRVVLWKLRWGRLQTFYKMREWWRPTSDWDIMVLFCNNEDKTPDHLFFVYEFGNHVWNATQTTMGWPKGKNSMKVVNISNIVEQLTSYHGDHYGQRIVAKVWHFWCERNFRWHQALMHRHKLKL